MCEYNDDYRLTQSDKMLQRVADGDLSQINSSAAKEQLTQYLIAEALVNCRANQKLMDVFDMLQDKYAEKIKEYIEDNDDETAIEYLPQMIKVISDSLVLTNDIIKDVVTNKDVQNLLVINQDNRQINIGSNAEETSSAVADPSSRAKIREAVEKVLTQIQMQEFEDDED